MYIYIYVERERVREREREIPIFKHVQRIKTYTNIVRNIYTSDKDIYKLAKHKQHNKQDIKTYSDI